MVKVRRSYETTAGERLSEDCLIDGYRAFHATDPVALASAPRTDAILVHPRPARLQVAGAFTHGEMRTVNEPYTQQESYLSTQTYTCGFGTTQSLCTRMVTNYRTVTKYRLVTKLVDVTDSKCESAIDWVPSVNGVYLLDFTYRDNDVCSLSCVQQLAQPDGTFVNQPCAPPTAEQLEAIERER